MRILLISSDPHLPHVRGGLQTTTHDLCLALQTAGAEPAVLCGIDMPWSGGRTDGPDMRADESLGYIVFGARDVKGALPVVTAAWRPDVLVVQSGTQIAAMALAAEDTGRPTAVYLHNVEHITMGGVLARGPSMLVLANSEFTARRWQALHGLECHVIPPLVDAGRHIAPDGPRDRVLYVNPVPVKGVERMFGLAEACPELPFLVVESWPLTRNWEEECRRRSARLPNIRWHKPAADMRPLYAQARVLLMPSVWEEAFGRTAVEAQINGIPVLASTRGALPDVVGDGGLLLDADGPMDEWAAALRELYVDSGTYAEAARRRGLGHAAASPLIAARLLELLAMHAAR